MNFIPSSMKKLVIASVTVMILGGAGLFVQQKYINKVNAANSFNTGLEVCFNRVAQTFTAIMIQQGGSGYLTSEFMGMSSDCFSELNKEASVISLESSKLNKLVSDTHWFHEKIKKSQSLLLDSEQSTTESNIDEKYSQLEELKDSVQETIFLAIKENTNKSDLYKFFATFCFATFTGLLLFGLSIAKKMRQKSNDIESMAQTILNKEKLNRVEVDGLVDMALTQASMPNTLSVVKKYMFENQIIEQESLPLPIIEDQRPVVNLNTIFDVSLKGIQNKAFKYGIIVDFDLHEDISVYADADGLSQVFYSLMNYAVDSSLKHNEGRKIIVRSTTYNETVNLNFSISNYMFSADELEFLTSNKLNENVDPNVLLLKEVIGLLDLRVEYKNKVDIEAKINNAQVVIAFEKAATNEIVEHDALTPVNADRLTLKFDYIKEEAPKLVKVMKGSKKEILDQMRRTRP